MNKIANAVTERMFQILFDRLPCDLGCVPVEFRENDPCIPYITEDCQTCWLNYIETQALLDLGLVERIDRAMEIYLGACKHEADKHCREVSDSDTCCEEEEDARPKAE